MRQGRASGRAPLLHLLPDGFSRRAPLEPPARKISAGDDHRPPAPVLGSHVTEHTFEVGLSFSGIPERLLIPFDALTGFFDPSVQFGLKFDSQDEDEDEDAERLPPRRSPFAAAPPSRSELKQPRKPLPAADKKPAAAKAPAAKAEADDAGDGERRPTRRTRRRQRRGRQPRRLPQEELSPFHSLDSRRCRRLLARALRQAHGQPAPRPQGDPVHAARPRAPPRGRAARSGRWSPARSRPPAARSSRRCRPAGPAPNGR